jgi:hypothetical protein
LTLPSETELPPWPMRQPEQWKRESSEGRQAPGPSP